MTILKQPHRRYNQLTGEWVLVSPHRALRPWQGQEEHPARDMLPEYDPNCYLCPGNKRAEGKINPKYTDTFVFTNDFPALLPQEKISAGQDAHPLLHAQQVSGTCRVICFSPHHNLTLANMPINDILQVINLWAQQTAELSQDYQWVQIFENRGAAMGCSNPHPHCQIWATNNLPNEALKEINTQVNYWHANKTALLQDYAHLELQQQERIVVKNTDWLVVVPFWAVWPFETLLIPLRHVRNLSELTAEERKSLAEIMQSLLIKYDRLFNVSFPYSMGWHGFNSQEEGTTLHAHYYPPLLRSATVKKFMVGYEMLAEPQRDITPEIAAKMLRECQNEK